MGYSKVSVVFFFFVRLMIVKSIFFFITFQPITHHSYNIDLDLFYSIMTKLRFEALEILLSEYKKETKIENSSKLII